jgi:hypothetical protein
MQRCASLYCKAFAKCFRSLHPVNEVGLPNLPQGRDLKPFLCVKYTATQTARKFVKYKVSQRTRP